MNLYGLGKVNIVCFMFLSQQLWDPPAPLGVPQGVRGWAGRAVDLGPDSVTSPGNVQAPVAALPGKLGSLC